MVPAVRVCGVNLHEPSFMLWLPSARLYALAPTIMASEQELAFATGVLPAAAAGGANAERAAQAGAAPPSKVVSSTESVHSCT